MWKGSFQGEAARRDDPLPDEGGDGGGQEEGASVTKKKLIDVSSGIADSSKNISTLLAVFKGTIEFVPIFAARKHRSAAPLSGTLDRTGGLPPTPPEGIR